MKTSTLIVAALGLVGSAKALPTTLGKTEGGIAKRWYGSNGQLEFDPSQPGVIGQYPDGSINSTYGLPSFDFHAILLGLNLELLELNLYNQAMDMLGGQLNAYSPGLQPYIEIFRNQEISHSTLLNTLTGGTFKNCTYTFPFFDVQSFLKFSQIVTSVGEGAYLGAVPKLVNHDYSAVFGAIIGNEARQNSFQRNESSLFFFNSVNYDTAITPSIAFSLAAGFIGDCPLSNPTLPSNFAKNLTYLNVTFIDSNIDSILPGSVNRQPQVGDPVQINYPHTLPNGQPNVGLGSIEGLSVAWINQLNPWTFTPLYSNYTTYLPAGVNGTAFLVITDYSSGYYNATNPIPDSNTYAAGALVVA